MKKKGNKKAEPNKGPEQPKVKQTDLLSVIDQYLLINETKKKISEIKDKKEKEEFKKFHAKNEEIVKEMNQLKESGNFDSIFKRAVELLTQNKEYEEKINSLKPKNDQISKEISSVNNNIINVNVNLAESEKINKISLQKLQFLNDEKKKIIQEEQKKFQEINEKCENFIKDFKSKIDDSIPDKDILLSENEKLKSQLEQAVKEANELKETLENEMKDKEVKTRRIEEELRTDIRVKMEEITFTNQKFLLENMELKNQNTLYYQKLNEVEKTIQQSEGIFSKMKEEIQKRNGRINQLEKENLELKTNEKKNDIRIMNIHLEYTQLSGELDIINKDLLDISINIKSLTDKLNTLKNTKP